MKTNTCFYSAKRPVFIVMMVIISALAYPQTASNNNRHDSVDGFLSGGCPYPLPFFEHWNYGFSWLWTVGGNGPENWGISNTIGNPAPAAYFSRTPPVTNYESWLESYVISARPYECADICFEFDIKLIDVFMNQSESLLVQYRLEDENWITLKEFTNAGSFDWQTESFVINDVLGELFRIRFVATGNSSTGIYYWYIDNIHVYAECRPPVNLIGAYLSDSVHLEWSSPDCNFAKSDPVIAGTVIEGYNIYRSDDYGETFQLINALPVTDTQYVDHNVAFQGYHVYYVTTLYEVCESIPSDTVIVEYLNLIEKPGNNKVRIYPVPAKNELTIATFENYQMLRIFNSNGWQMHQQMIENEKMVTINTSTFASGHYHIQLTNNNAEIFNSKILIIR